MVKVIVGLMGGSVGAGSSKLSTPEQVRPLLSMLASHKVKELDTARVYNSGKSEELLGEIQDTLLQHDFEIATKAPGFYPGALTYDNIIKNCNASLAALKTTKMDLYYFHGPDRQTPLEESCRAIHQLHKEGKFNRFGVSNFTKDEVLEVVSICKQNGWILPSVYQGGYNPFLRTMESKLLPTLREHSIAFYAYSPLGGGFFSRTSEQLKEPPSGSRMDQMKVFKQIYVNDLSLELHDHLQRACEAENITMQQACLRWLMYHSPLNSEDGIILGGSSQEQMEQNLEACEGGPLPDRVIASFDNMWTRYVAEKGYPDYSV